MPTVERPFTATIMSPHLDRDRQAETETETDCHCLRRLKRYPEICSACKSQFRLTINMNRVYDLLLETSEVTF